MGECARFACKKGLFCFLRVMKFNEKYLLGGWACFVAKKD